MKNFLFPFCFLLLFAVFSVPAVSAGTVNVSIVNFAFSPAQVTIEPGDTVIWTNTDTAPHTVTGSGGGTFSSGAIPTGGTFSFNFINSGTFTYACDFHPSMTGAVTVNGNIPAPVVTPVEPLIDPPVVIVPDPVLDPVLDPSPIPPTLVSPPPPIVNRLTPAERQREVLRAAAPARVAAQNRPIILSQSGPSENLLFVVLSSFFMLGVYCFLKRCWS